MFDISDEQLFSAPEITLKIPPPPPSTSGITLCKKTSDLRSPNLFLSDCVNPFVQQCWLTSAHDPSHNPMSLKNSD